MEHKSQSLFFGTIALVVIGIIWSSTSESHAEEASLGSIEVRVTGLPSEEGQVCASLYNSSDGYPTRPEKALHRGCSPIEKRQGSIVFDGLPYGTYAAFAFHDQDANNQVKSNRIGIPREPIGASNAARGRFGPPSFSDASFELNAPRKLVPIVLRAL